MISDRTIDESTAKYWCAFADGNFKKALDTVLKTIADDSAQKTAEDMLKASSKELNEGFADFMAKYAPTDPAVGSTGIVGDLAGKSQEEIKANAAAMTTAAAIAATALTPAKKVVGAAMRKHPKATALAIAGTAFAADAVSDKDDTWWQKLEKLVNKVWDIGKFTAQHGKAIAVASTTAYALFKTANIWLPMLGSLVKSIFRGNSLATVDFDSNGTWYRIRYDIKSKRWELMYKGFSMGASPAPEEVDQLLNTKFFRAFIEQCQKYISPIAENAQRSAVLEAISQLTDKKTKSAIESVLLDPMTLSNMFAMKFKY